ISKALGSQSSTNTKSIEEVGSKQSIPRTEPSISQSIDILHDQSLPLAASKYSSAVTSVSENDLTGSKPRKVSIEMIVEEKRMAASQDNLTGPQRTPPYASPAPTPLAVKVESRGGSGSQALFKSVGSFRSSVTEKTNGAGESRSRFSYATKRTSQDVTGEGKSSSKELNSAGKEAKASNKDLGSKHLSQTAVSPFAAKPQAALAEPDGSGTSTTPPKEEWPTSEASALPPHLIQEGGRSRRFDSSASETSHRTMPVKTSSFRTTSGSSPTIEPHDILARLKTQASMKAAGQSAQTIVDTPKKPDMVSSDPNLSRNPTSLSRINTVRAPNRLASYTVDGALVDAEPTNSGRSSPQGSNSPKSVAAGSDRPKLTLSINKGLKGDLRQGVSTPQTTPKSPFLNSAGPAGSPNAKSPFSNASVSGAASPFARSHSFNRNERSDSLSSNSNRPSILSGMSSSPKVKGPFEQASTAPATPSDLVPKPILRNNSQSGHGDAAPRISFTVTPASSAPPITSVSEKLTSPRKPEPLATIESCSNSIDSIGSARSDSIKFRPSADSRPVSTTMHHPESASRKPTSNLATKSVLNSPPTTLQTIFSNLAVDTDDTPSGRMQASQDSSQSDVYYDMGQTSMFTIPGNPHLVNCFPGPGPGLFELSPGWETEGNCRERLTVAFADTRYNIWRRVVFETLPAQRDFPLLVPDDLNGALYDDFE
ncbi:hypothetical protein HDU91_005253, partial [Kappamyces sp. JEL0680]